jgi:hypothetical protein
MYAGKRFQASHMLAMAILSTVPHTYARRAHVASDPAIWPENDFPLVRCACHRVEHEWAQRGVMR